MSKDDDKERKSVAVSYNPSIGKWVVTVYDGYGKAIAQETFNTEGVARHAAALARKRYL